MIGYDVSIRTNKTSFRFVYSSKSRIRYSYDLIRTMSVTVRVVGILVHGEILYQQPGLQWNLAFMVSRGWNWFWSKLHLKVPCGIFDHQWNYVFMSGPPFCGWHDTHSCQWLHIIPPMYKNHSHSPISQGRRLQASKQWCKQCVMLYEERNNLTCF